MIQNAAARLVFNEPKRAHFTPLFIFLHWVPVVARIKFKTLMFVYRTATASAPSYFHSLLWIYIPTRSLRSISKRYLVVTSQRGIFIHLSWLVKWSSHTRSINRTPDTLSDSNTNLIPYRPIWHKNWDQKRTCIKSPTWGRLNSFIKTFFQIVNRLNTESKQRVLPLIWSLQLSISGSAIGYIAQSVLDRGLNSLGYWTRNPTVLVTIRPAPSSHTLHITIIPPVTSNISGSPVCTRPHADSGFPLWTT